MKHTTEIQTRFFDTDAIGHLSNIAYALYAEQGRLTMLSSIDNQASDVILARLAIDYRKQSHLGEALRVDSWIEKIGRTSFTIKQQISAGDDLRAETEAVMVLFDYAAQKPKPIDDTMRAHLQKFLA